MTTEQDTLDTRRRRALFRAEHRGTREMDWILGRFARSELDKLEENELSAFELLLALADPDIEQWVMHGAGEPPGGEVGVLIERVRKFHEIGQ